MARLLQPMAHQPCCGDRAIATKDDVNCIGVCSQRGNKRDQQESNRAERETRIEHANAMVLWRCRRRLVDMGVHRTHPERRLAMAVSRVGDCHGSRCNPAIRIRRVASQARAAARIGW